MDKYEPLRERWRGFYVAGRRRPWTIVAAATVALAAVGVVLLAPWLMGPGLILTIQLAVLAFVVYLAVRLALRHRQP